MKHKVHNTEKSVTAYESVLLQAENYQYNQAYLSFSCISLYKITFSSLLPVLTHRTTAVWYSEFIRSFSILIKTPCHWMTFYNCYLHPEHSIVQKCLTTLTVHVRVWLNSETFSVTVNKITQILIVQGAMPIKESWILKGELYRKVHRWEVF
jgi:hypothetical protein